MRCYNVQRGGCVGDGDGNAVVGDGGVDLAAFPVLSLKIAVEVNSASARQLKLAG